MTTRSNSPSLEELDRKYLLHPQTSIRAHQSSDPRIIEAGAGVHVYDQSGRKTLDGIAGLWCVNVGYGRKELADAMAQEASRLGYYHSFTGASNPPQIRLAERLVGLAPAPLGKVMFGMSGSDANDTIVKIAWRYNIARGRPEKRKIISRIQAYHGVTVASASLTGLPAFHAAFGLPIDNILHTDCPHHYRFAQDGESERDFSKRLAASLDRMIETEGADTVAAFIAEPIMGAGGVIDPPEGYFEEIQAVLKKHDVLMVADEVICGFGRLGRWFGSNVFDIKPDMMSCAKGLTSGYFPYSASFISDEIFECLLDGEPEGAAFAHGFTYGGHPVGAAVALANLDIMEKEGLVERAAERGAYLHARLRDRFADHPRIGEIRGQGLLAALQLMDDAAEKRFLDPALKTPAKIAAATHEAGAIVRALPSVNSIALSPPLTILEGEIDTLIDAVATGLDSVLGA